MYSATLPTRALSVFVGHSRTVVGYEQFRNGSIRLLIFDPSTSKTDAENFLRNANGKAHLFRRTLQSFQKPEYQILVIRRLLHSNEREVDWQRARRARQSHIMSRLASFHFRLRNNFVRRKYRQHRCDKHCALVNILCSSLDANPTSSLSARTSCIYRSRRMLPLLRLSRFDLHVSCCHCFYHKFISALHHVQSSAPHR